MTYSKIEIYRISILAMIFLFVCFTKVDQATATKVKIEEFICWVCETKFSAPVGRKNWGQVLTLGVLTEKDNFHNPFLGLTKCSRCISLTQQYTNFF